MKLVLWFALFLRCASLYGQETRMGRAMGVRSDCTAVNPCQSTLNAAWDATGTPDTRPGTWGNAGFVRVSFQFSNVPKGYRVRIVRMYGDYIAWARGSVTPSTHAGILFGFLSTAPDGSKFLQEGTDDCFLYHQGAVSGGDFTQFFDNNVEAGGLLQPDNVMVLQMAIYLNETGASIHQEVTADVVYQFEPLR